MPTWILDNLVIVGGLRSSRVSDIEAVSLDEDITNCDPTDLPYKLGYQASVYTPVLNGFLVCGSEYENGTSKCIIQSKRNDSNQFPALSSVKIGLSLTSISNKIYAIGGLPVHEINWESSEYNIMEDNIMETINFNTDRQWKKEEMPFSVFDHCSVGLGNDIIVTGGWGKNWIVSKLVLKLTWNKIVWVSNFISSARIYQMPNIMVAQLGGINMRSNCR